MIERRDDDAEWDTSEAEFDARFAAGQPVELVEKPSGRVHVLPGALKISGNVTGVALTGVHHGGGSAHAWPKFRLTVSNSLSGTAKPVRENLQL